MRVRLSTRWFVSVLFILIAVSSFADDTNAPPAVGVTTNENGKLTITTTKGVTYENCKITRAEPDGLSLFHSKGIAKIPFTELPPQFAKRYGYDPKEAYEYSREMAKRRAEFAKEQERAAERRQRELARQSRSSSSSSSSSRSSSRRSSGNERVIILPPGASQGQIDAAREASMW